MNDLIEHTKGGYLVQGFDPEDYAVKIRRMFTEKMQKVQFHVMCAET